MRGNKPGKAPGRLQSEYEIHHARFLTARCVHWDEGLTVLRMHNLYSEEQSVSFVCNDIESGEYATHSRRRRVNHAPGDGQYTPLT